MDEVFEGVPTLSPCPFCGSDKVQFCYSYRSEISGIYCSRCQMKATFTVRVSNKDTYGKTMQQWAEKWNRRDT